MVDKANLDRVRTETLDQIERAEKNYKLAFLLAAGTELLFLVGFLLLADLHDRLHLLLLVTTVAIYTIVALGLIALGAHVNRNTRLILRAVELSGGREARIG